MDKKVFTAKIDDKDVELAIVSPNAKVIQDAQFYYGKVFADALKNGCLLRAKLEDYVKDQGVWNEQKTKDLENFDKTINDGLAKIQRGGIKLKQARRIAIDIRAARAKRTMLLAERFNLNANTAEGRADNARFQYQVYLCLVYNESGDRVFQSYDEFLEHLGDDYVIKACELFSSMHYGMDDDFEKNLPENQFLAKWKFTDNQLRLINEKGELIDVNGNQIDENGFKVTDKQEEIKHEPFLDDSGKPVE